jgi:hypothetical protein
MNIIEKEIVDVLKQLKEYYGVYEIKAEFEAEGSRIEEMMRLKDVTERAGLPIILKIGGVEAVTDIFNGLLIGVNGIIAPMAETSFAVSKFISSIKKFVPEDNSDDIDFAVNIETIKACKNIDEILSLDGISLIHGITVGRSDLVGSMGLDKKDVDSKEVFELAQGVLAKAKRRNIKTAIGGTVTATSIGFIRNLVSDGVLDKYETRKVVFPKDTINNQAEIGLELAFKFEYLWLKSKQRYYSRIKLEDQSRIDALEKRFS